MQKSNFYEFTRPVQERFIGSVNGTGMPTPLLERRGGPSLPMGWLGLTVGGVVALFVLFPLGLGNLESGLAIQSVGLLVAYVVAIAAAVFGTMKTLAARWEVSSLPFRPGIYVFPIGLVDARRFVLEIFSLSEITGVTEQGTTLVVAFDGGASFSFSFPNAEEMAAGKERLTSAKSHLDQANATRESLRPGALAGIDPFHGAASPFVPNKALLREVPTWARIPWAFAAAVGVLLGLGVWALRNQIGDRRLYAAALERNDVDAYRAYLTRGRKFTDEVERVRLPRAELRLAEKIGSVDAIESYIESHPRSAIPDEVQAARRTALLGELERSKQAGTVTALREFDRKHPKHGLDAELKKATHQVYVAALEKYKAQLAPKDEAATRFMTDLVTLAEQRGPAVLVRFKRKPSKTLDKADSLVTKNKFFNGTQSFPTKYFDGAHLQPREVEMGNVILQRFAEAFPKDILTVELGPPLADAEAVPAAVTAPTLFVEHEVEWAGGVVTSTNPRGVFIGAGILFESTFRLPGDAKPLKAKATDWRAPDVSNLKGETKPEEKLYESMARSCFEGFTKRLVGTLFRPAGK